MTGNRGVIERLNAALVAETRSSTQYMLHAALLDNWGFGKLSRHERQEAKEERGHFRRFADRATLLGGKLDIDTIDAPLVGTNVVDLLNADLQLERDAVTTYSEAAIFCRVEAKDLVSANIFETTLKDEEDHVNWLETQLALIDQLGLDLYLQANV